MDVLFIGQNKTGKTTAMKKYINELSGKKIVLDFGNEYEDFTDNVLFLDDLNPLLSELTLSDIKALNAGYLDSSNCLHKKAEEILRELKSTLPQFKDYTFDEVSHELKKEGLVEESIERLQISWDNTETQYGKLLNQKIPTKKHKKHFPLNEALDILNSSDRIILKSKSMHSDHLRAITFILLSNLSLKSNESFYIIGDELSSFFNNGNSNLFFKTIKKEKLNFIVSFNKISSVPSKIFPRFDKYFVHRFESNSEIRDLKKYGINIGNDLKTLKCGENIEIENTKSTEAVL